MIQKQLAALTIPVMFAFSLLVFPVLTATAQGIVPCDGPDCQACDFVQLGDNIVDFFITVMVIVGAIVIVYGGLKMVMSAGDTGALSRGKEYVFNAIFGLIIVLAAWLIIDTVMKSFYDESAFGPWNTIECAAQFELTSETKLEGTVSGFSFTTYSYDTANTCKVVSVRNFSDITSCLAAESQIVASGGYIAESCDGTVLAGASPTWVDAPECGVPTSPAGQICYAGSGTGQVCFDAYSDIANNVSGYTYPSGGGTPPSQFVDTQNPGNGNSMSTKVSANYSLGEFNISSTCGSGGRYMFISPRAVQGLEGVVNTLGKGKLGLNSAFRSPSCNTQVGGAAASRHMYGYAFDIRIPSGVSKQAIIDACKANGSGFQQQYATTNHVHCDWR